MREKKKSEELLFSLFPREVALELIESKKATPKLFNNVTVMFTDFIGFTKLSSDVDPSRLIDELNDVFSAFDSIVERNSCERIKTIGDGYLAVCGLPNENPEHAHNIVRCALDFIDYLKIRNGEPKHNNTLKFIWNIRIGINTGPVVGGIVGTKKYLYDIFGDTVNTASRLEGCTENPGIIISESTYNLVRDSFNCTDVSYKDIKGKGKTAIYKVIYSNNF